MTAGAARLVPARGRRWLAPGLLALVLGVVVWQNAWLSDDAFISFRTVDNAVHGLGLRWNTGERVQTFTNPLWTLLLTAAAGLTGEICHTALWLSLVLTLGAATVLSVTCGAGWLACVGLAALLASRAFIDYATSGLENALSYLLLASFVMLALREAGKRRTLGLAGAAAGLLLVNRLDAAPLLAPALVLLVARAPQRGRAAAVVAAGLLPLLAWELFALGYYGFLIPNTAYAKLTAGVPESVLLGQGLRYSWDFVRRDPAGAALLLGGILAGCALRARERGIRRALALGIVLELGYVAAVGGDFMSGRFFTLPLLCALALLLDALRPRPRAQRAALMALLALALLPAHAPLRTGKHCYDNTSTKDVMRGHGIADERGAYYRATSPLWAQAGKPWPDHPWADWGRQLARSGEYAVVVANTVGMRGFYAGPRIHIVDRFGLADPLLARLPMLPDPAWRIGHFRREPPAGYQETLRTGQSALSDPDTAELVAHLQQVTRGPLWSRERLTTIWRFQTGGYRALIDRVRRSYAASS